jgi:hypothetical protein
MPENFANRYQTHLDGAVTSGALTGVVESTTGIPAVPFRAIISAEGANTNEIVLVTGRAGTTLTWTRAAEAVAGVQAASAHGDGALFTAIVTAAQATRWEEGRYDVRNYGAVGDGVADDQPAFQAAIDAAEAAGGGKVFIPPGTYKLTTVQNVPGDTDTHLVIDASKVTIAGSGSTSIITTSVAAAIFGVNQFEFGIQDATVHPITASIASGVTSITLDPASGASNFSAGDHILISTGQTLAGSARDQCDAEINRVLTADGGTGVITLAWPTAKPYAQEYYISGTTGVTSTTPTANPAPYGASNIDALIVTDIAFRDFHIEQTGFQHVLIGGGIVGLTVENVTGTLRGAFQSMGLYRFGRISGCRFHHTGTGAVSYTFTAAVGTSDVQWVDNFITGERVIQFHIHEGSARVSVLNNHILTASSASDENHISVRVRAYDIQIVGNIITGSIGGFSVYVDESCTGGGILAQNSVLGASSESIAVSASNWFVPFNRTPNASQISFSRYTGTDNEVHVLSGWLTPAQTTTILGTIPSNAFLISQGIFVYQEFNSDGSDLVTIGTDAFNDLFSSATDVSTTGNKTVGAGQWGLGFGFDGASRVAKAYYVAGGSAPTIGKAVCTLVYGRVPDQP